MPLSRLQGMINFHCSSTAFFPTLNILITREWRKHCYLHSTELFLNPYVSNEVDVAPQSVVQPLLELHCSFSSFYVKWVGLNLGTVYISTPSLITKLMSLILQCNFLLKLCSCQNDVLKYEKPHKCKQYITLKADWTMVAMFLIHIPFTFYAVSSTSK